MILVLYNSYIRLFLKSHSMDTNISEYSVHQLFWSFVLCCYIARSVLVIIDRVRFVTRLRQLGLHHRQHLVHRHLSGIFQAVTHSRRQRLS